jgi:hypothetical protein
MIFWMRRLMAFILPLLIGVGPVSACTQKMATPSPKMVTTSPAAHGCCAPRHQNAPQPTRNCEDCPIMNRPHTVIDQGAHRHANPFNSISWAFPPVPLLFSGSAFHRAVETDESPPHAPGDLYHLHCQLIL